MQANLEGGGEQILHTIDLTSKLEHSLQSLRKLLTKKKPFENDLFAFSSSPKHQKEESQLTSKMQLLEEENKELYSDNQQLSRELLSVKEELRECKKELAGTKKYLLFLQSYNDDLKKEMLYWMKNRKEASSNNEGSTMGDLMSKVIKLRKENEENQKKLLSLKDTLEVKTQNTYPRATCHQSLNFDLSKFENQLINRKKSQSGKEQEGSHCGSCSHNNKSKSKSKKKKVDVAMNYSTSSKQVNRKTMKDRNLRKWHNHYVSNSEFAY